MSDDLDATHRSRSTDPDAAVVLTGVRDLVVGAERRRRRLQAELGMTGSEVVALAFLYAHDRATPGVLADGVGLTTGSVTALLDRLEMSGLLRREPNPDDRRSLLVTLTPTGQETMRRGFAATLDSVTGALCELRRRHALDGVAGSTIAEILTEIGRHLGGPDPD